MNSSNDQSPIVDFYRNKSIFITGASGFIGKVLVEKLLRTCPNLNKIYFLLRPKTNSKTKKFENINDRFNNEFVESKLFIHVDKELIKSKLQPLDGDLLKNNFGLNENEIKLICDNVNIVFHVAASVRFDHPLRKCLEYNVYGTRTILELCHKMLHLDCFVHVSTAYAYCNQERSEERLYPLKVKTNQIIDFIEWADEKTLKKSPDLVNCLMENRPNTYTFTKAVAEHYVNENRGQLPVAIARPSIVTASVKEPFPGYTDSQNGPGGATLLGTLGIARSMLCKPDRKADLIPIDIVTNSLIVIAWKTATDYHQEKLITNNNDTSFDKNGESSTLPIYNITSGDVNPITWENFLEYGREAAFTKPSTKMVRLPAQAPKGDSVNWYGHQATKVFSEILFAYFFDFIMILTNNAPFLVKLVKKMHAAFSLLEFFATRQWSFPCNNLLNLYDSLSDKDKKLFNFDIRKVNWKTYTCDFYLGLRRFLLDEPDNNTKEGLAHLNRLKMAYTIMDLIVLVLFVSFIYWLIPISFGQINNFYSLSTVKSIVN